MQKQLLLCLFQLQEGGRRFSGALSTLAILDTEENNQSNGNDEHDAHG